MPPFWLHVIDLLLHSFRQEDITLQGVEVHHYLSFRTVRDYSNMAIITTHVKISHQAFSEVKNLYFRYVKRLIIPN